MEMSEEGIGKRGCDGSGRPDRYAAIPHGHYDLKPGKLSETQLILSTAANL